MPGHDNKVMNMKCKEVRLLIMPYLGNDTDITADEHQAFEQHLQSCERCAKDYEESKIIVELIKEYWPLDEEMLAEIAPPKPPATRYMTVEEGWQDLCRRCPDLAEDPKHQKYLRMFYKVGAVAACLIIGVSAWLMFSPDSRPETKQEVVTRQLAFDPFLTVELVSDNQKTSIPTGQKLKTSSNELKNLVINNKHQIVMNADTTLSIDPFTTNGSLGCIVELVSGQIFSHVERNGNPFIVETSHGRAVITGTTFDIKVTDDATTLVVSEGSVQFESQRGVVTVGAGQISEIVRQSAPAEPRACNTDKMTAWAISNQVKPSLTRPRLRADISELEHLELPVKSGPINLEAINYESWVGQKRDWFKREFPQAFQLKEALAKKDIEVDYPQLLIQSGYIRRFVYPESSATRLAFPDFQLLLEAVLPYGLDRQWLLKNVPATK